MKVLVPGTVIDYGATTFKGQKGETIGAAWVVLYQGNGSDQPGETAKVWTSTELGLKKGDEVLIECGCRAEGGTVKLSRARLVQLNGAKSAPAPPGGKTG